MIAPSHNKVSGRFFMESLICLMACLPSIFAIIFHPALPQVTGHFQLEMKDVQFLSMWFLFGEALGQLPYGPIANRYGKRNTLLFGVMITAFGLFLAILSGYFHSFAFFMVSQILIAIGSCVGPNIAYTTIGDFYDQRSATRIVALTLFCTSLIPAAFNYFGGVLAHSLGWIVCFCFLLLFCLGTLPLFVFLPEKENGIDPEGLKPGKILKEYVGELKNPLLVISSLIIGCGVCIVYLFSSIAPYVAMHDLGVTPKDYGMWGFVSTTGFLAGALTTKWLANKISLTKQLFIGSNIILVAAFVMQGLFWIKMHMAVLFLPMACIQFALAFLYTNATSIALTRATNKSIGSSLLNCINLGVGGGCVWLIRTLNVYASSLLPILFLTLGGVILFMVSYLAILLRKDRSSV